MRYREGDVVQLKTDLIIDNYYYGRSNCSTARACAFTESLQKAVEKDNNFIVIEANSSNHTYIVKNETTDYFYNVCLPMILTEKEKEELERQKEIEPTENLENESGYKKLAESSEESFNIQNNNNGKGENIMKKFANMFKFSAGAKEIKAGEVALTMFNGVLAVKNAEGNYVSYNPSTNTIVNAHDFVMQGEQVDGMFFVMPAMEIVPTDILLKNNTYYFVKEVEADGTAVTVDLMTGAETRLIKETSIFGMSFYWKVFSMASALGIQGNPMIQMAFMSQLFSGDDDSTDKGNSFGSMIANMAQMQMTSQMLGGNNGMINPIGGGLFGNMFGMQPNVTTPIQPTTYTADQVQDIVNQAVSLALKDAKETTPPKQQVDTDTQIANEVQ